MEQLYKEMQGRLKYLEEQEQTDEIKYRIAEITLCIVKVQQLLLANVRHSEDIKDKFLKKVEQIAQTYHDRLCISNLTMEGQICKCCESIVITTTSIEHDSKDYSKDLSICSNCYSHIATWWKNNKPRKIAPI